LGSGGLEGFLPTYEETKSGVFAGRVMVGYAVALEGGNLKVSGRWKVRKRASSRLPHTQLVVVWGNFVGGATERISKSEVPSREFTVAFQNDILGEQGVFESGRKNVNEKQIHSKKKKDCTASTSRTPPTID